MDNEAINKKIKIRSIIAKKLNKSVEDITEEKSIVKDLGADSLDVVEIIISIEEELNIEISDDLAASIVTVKDIYDLIDDNERNN